MDLERNVKKIIFGNVLRNLKVKFTMFSIYPLSQATKLSFCDVHIECCYQVFGISLFARGAPA